MNRSDVLALQAQRGSALVSILCPTHRTKPDNRRDPIAVRNLMDEVAARLRAAHGKREAEALIARIEECYAEVDWLHTLDGLAIFVSDDSAAIHYLPFPVVPRAIIDDTFVTRDLVAGLARGQRYRVLALSEKPTRLYDAVADDLEEHVGGGFPRVHDGPGGAVKLEGGSPPRSSQRQAAHKEFFRQIDRDLGAILATDPTPIVVTGVSRYLSYFGGLTEHGAAILATVEGSYDKTPAPELGRLVWPKVEAALAAQRQQRIAELEAAVGAGRCASGLVQAWRAAAEGRGAHLLVDQGYHQAGVVAEDGLSLALTDDSTTPGVMDDAVDELVERVMARGGEVTFVAGGLERHDRLALILRY